MKTKGCEQRDYVVEFQIRVSVSAEHSFPRSPDAPHL